MATSLNEYITNPCRLHVGRFQHTTGSWSLCLTCDLLEPLASIDFLQYESALYDLNHLHICHCHLEETMVQELFLNRLLRFISKNPQSKDLARGGKKT